MVEPLAEARRMAAGESAASSRIGVDGGSVRANHLGGTLEASPGPSSRHGKEDAALRGRSYVGPPTEDGRTESTRWPRYVRRMRRQSRGRDESTQTRPSPRVCLLPTTALR